MRRCNILIGLALATLLATAPEVFAQVVPVPVTVTVDENGHGTASIPGTVFTLQATQSQDPGPGGLSGALTYSFSSPLAGVPIVVGDVILSEPGASMSDLIRFNQQNPNSVGTLVFYSDKPEVDALADIGFPTANYTNVITMAETGTEGVNGLTYTPTSGQPGFVTGEAVTYMIQSDVPEPASIIMGGTSLTMGVVYFWIRRRRGARSPKELASR
jgi:hypothetical protein